MPKTLTPCQEEAIKVFTGFLCTNEKYMVISGAPGTGKSFLINELISKLPDLSRIVTIMGSKPLEGISVAATTNKAADVLTETLKRVTTTTVHSLLGLRVKNDYRTGAIVTDARSATPISNQLIIIDEAFMADSQLLDFIDKLTPECKVILVGDHCQLFSVSEKVSPILDKGYLTAHLKTQVRTDGNPVLTALNTQLRESVETSVFKPIEPVKGIIDIVSDSEMKQLLHANFISQVSPRHQIIAYSNNAVQEYNTFIRAAKGLPDMFTVGETVVSNNSIETSHGRTRIERKYEVVALGGTVSRCAIDCKEVMLSGIGHTLMPVNFKEYTFAIQEAAKRKDWSLYFALKEQIADLRASFACTTHKAQGSTYDTVYIDMNDLMGCKEDKEFMRLLYVAVSRASKRVVMYKR